MIGRRLVESGAGASVVLGHPFIVLVQEFEAGAASAPLAVGETW